MDWAICREIEHEAMDWIQLALGKSQWYVLMNRQVP
jgi:hypothetical protein